MGGVVFWTLKCLQPPPYGITNMMHCVSDTHRPLPSLVCTPLCLTDAANFSWQSLFLHLHGLLSYTCHLLNKQWSTWSRRHHPWKHQPLIKSIKPWMTVIVTDEKWVYVFTHAWPYTHSLFLCIQFHIWMEYISITFCPNNISLNRVSSTHFGMYILALI